MTRRAAIYLLVTTAAVLVIASLIQLGGARFSTQGVPATLGVALYARYAPPGVAFHAFALFCGIAMSITAFPVLARILEDRNLTRTPLGATAITSAAVNDVTAWSVLAFVVAITTAGGALQTLIATVTLSATFAAVMVVVIRPLLQRAIDPDRIGGSLGNDHVAIALLVALSSALVTEIIGIHALFGAFVAGVIMPVGGAFGAALRTRLESITSVILLPLFFAYTGLRTHIGLLHDGASWATCLVIIAVATAGTTEDRSSPVEICVDELVREALVGDPAPARGTACFSPDARPLHRSTDSFVNLMSCPCLTAR